MENAGSADAFLQSLHSPEWNVEHGLAGLNKGIKQSDEGTAGASCVPCGKAGRISHKLSIVRATWPHHGMR